MNKEIEEILNYYAYQSHSNMLDRIIEESDFKEVAERLKSLLTQKEEEAFKAAREVKEYYRFRDGLGFFDYQHDSYATYKTNLNQEEDEH